MTDPRMNSQYPQIDKTLLIKQGRRKAKSSYTNGKTPKLKVPDYYNPDNIIDYYLKNNH